MGHIIMLRSGAVFSPRLCNVWNFVALLAPAFLLGTRGGGHRLLYCFHNQTRPMETTLVKVCQIV